MVAIVEVRMTVFSSLNAAFSLHIGKGHLIRVKDFAGTFSVISYA